MFTFIENLLLCECFTKDKAIFTYPHTIRYWQLYIDICLQQVSQTFNSVDSQRNYLVYHLQCHSESHNVTLVTVQPHQGKLGEPFILWLCVDSLHFCSRHCGVSRSCKTYWVKRGQDMLTTVADYSMLQQQITTHGRNGGGRQVTYLGY